MVSNGVVFFRGCVDDGRVLMRESGQIYTILLRVKGLVMSSEDMALEGEGMFCKKENSLASFAIVQSKGLILSCGYDLIASVVEADRSYVSRPRIR